MQLNSQHVWAPRLSASGVAALLAASAVYWVLRWPAGQDAGAALTRVAQVAAEDAVAPADTTALAQLLGSGKSAEAGPVGPAGRFVLSGVVAGVAGHGAALISIDGAAARAYRVGSRVTEDLVLQSVATRRAMLAASAQAPVSVTLELKAPEAKAGAAMTPAMQAPRASQGSQESQAPAVAPPDTQAKPRRPRYGGPKS